MKKFKYLIIGLTLLISLSFFAFTSCKKIDDTKDKILTTVEISNVKTYSDDKLQENLGFVNKGNVIVNKDNNTIKVDKMEPKDKITLDIKVTNDSFMDVKSNIIISSINNSELFEEMDIVIDEKHYHGMNAYTNWYTLGMKNDDKSKSFSVTISYPKSYITNKKDTEYTLKIENDVVMASVEKNELKEKEENTIIKNTNDELINKENINLEQDNIEIENVENIVNVEGTEPENKIFTPLPNDYNKKNNSFGVLSLFSLLFFIFVIILLITYCTFTIINNKSDKIAKGIYIKGIDVSNLSKEDALNKISEHINSSIPDDLTLIHDDYETSISSESIEINFNVEEAVNIAYDIGKTGNIFENNINILKTLISNINIEPAFSINDNQLISELKDISAKLPDKMIESSYYIDGTNLIITKGNTGCAVNIDESYNIIKNKIYNLDIKNSIELSTLEQSPTEINLDNIYSEIHKEPVNAYYTQNPFSVFPSENGVDFAISLDEAKQSLNSDSNECTIPLKVLYPSVTTNMIGTEAFPDLLSEFSTNYSVSNKNRTTNLILASNKINGTVVMPGETFSYNKVVGARTIAAGYKEAPIYVSGKVVDGLGGGICQITTTLYNAVLLSNLEIVERSNHQFVPSYANASRDATVVYGAIDFKFKNNREYPIKITCSVSKGIANFKIWGLKSDNDYEVVLSSRVTGSNANYLYSEGYKTLKKDGQIVSTEVISKDVYKRH